MAAAETIMNQSPAGVEPWETRVARKQEQCKSLIPPSWTVPETILGTLEHPLKSNPNRLTKLDIPRRSGIMTDRELAITEDYTVAALLDGLAKGSLTSVEVTVAFSKRAAIAQQLISCLTETFFDEALARATYLDECKANGKILGPLHGLPISIKDSFQVKGHEATIGFVSLLDKKSTENSALVDILLELGAVIYVKTNIPQTMMTADSDNNIFGRTLNPHNTALTAGGSSGGEGALIAFRGSPLGIGTDIAGSIRIPSLCCGTYGFKPSSSRIPFGGQVSPVLEGMHAINPTAGPIANDFDALEITSKAIIDSEPARLDSSVIDVPWRDGKKIALASKDKLTIGVLAEDPLYPLHPPVKRALDEAVSRLTAVGHNIVPLTAAEGRVGDASEVGMHMFGLDSKTTPGFIAASGEPLVPSVAKTLASMMGKSDYTFVPNMADLDTFHRLAALNLLRSEIIDSWRRVWQEKKIDVVIAPGAQHTALSHDDYGWPPYTLLLNVLDYPATIIPFSESSKVKDPTPATFATANPLVPYDPEVLDGAPCSIQIFTSSMRDEECLLATKIIDKCLKA